jgi:hypothetical protein
MTEWLMSRLQILAAGYRALLSNYDALYLDHLDLTWEKVKQIADG